MKKRCVLQAALGKVGHRGSWGWCNFEAESSPLPAMDDPPPQAPSRPNRLRAESVGSTIHLSWTKPSGCNSSDVTYNIFGRRGGEAESFGKLATVGRKLSVDLGESELGSASGWWEFACTAAHDSIEGPMSQPSLPLEYQPGAARKKPIWPPAPCDNSPTGGGQNGRSLATSQASS